jgi:DNA-binding transcriptional LysR family regulator
MELRHLRYFVTVAEELHFGRAAVRLNMAQPPLSQQINKLEDELGFPLLLRNKHHVELTPAGKVFLEEARITLVQADKAAAAAWRAHEGVEGRLTIGFVGSVTYNIVPLLQKYRLQFPMVHLSLHQMKSAHQLQALHEKKIQLGILRPPVQSPYLESETIHKEAYVAALPESHPLAGRDTLRVEELAGDEFIISSRNNGSYYHDAVIRLCRDSGFYPRIALEAPEILTIVAFVSAGLGVSIVPASFRSQQNRMVVYRELENDSHLETAFVWRKDDRPPVLDKFLQLCKPSMPD